MAQPQNFTNAVFENNLSEYETIGDRTLDAYDNIEMQPNLKVEEEKDEKIFPDTKHKICLKKNVRLGILIAVIIALVIVIAVMAYVFLSSKAQGGNCKTYKYIRNGQIIRSTGSRHGDTLEIQCDKNSKLIGTNTITCLSSDVWSADPHCVLKECGKFVLTQHMAARSDANLTTIGSVISLFCEKGFQLSGNSSVICQTDEEWSTSPTCKHVDCGSPMVIRNAKQYRVKKTSYNSSFTVECVEGYTLIGSETVTCNIDGKWDILPVCEIVSYGTPNIPAHASITNLTGTSFQSTVAFKCDEGYSIDGNSVISCTSSGNWTDLPSCKVITDCFDIYNNDGIKNDGIYTIRTWETHQMIQVYCDMTTAGGGWTVFQYRFNESVDFNRTFSEYENGFGALQSEFWLGLKYIQEIASQSNTHLRVDVEAQDGRTAYETFNMFELSHRPAYTLYLGDTIQSFNKINRFGKWHNGSIFSTFDHDVDAATTANCASAHGGGWWYNSCFHVNLNGRFIYYHGFVLNGKLKSSKMMIRRN